MRDVEVKELMKSIGFGYPGGPDRAANLELRPGRSAGKFPGFSNFQAMPLPP